MRYPIAAVIGLAAAVPLSAQAASDLDIATPLAGSWSYHAASDGSQASFASASGPVQLWIHCARATRRVSIARPAAAAAPFLNIWTSAQTRNVPANFDPATGRITAELGAYDSLLDGLANSRGRVGFTTGPQPSLVLPAWPEIARVIEDCRA